ncbi:MAG: complement resistance protein TraT [Fusobacteriaceae bacterium]
MRRKILAIMVLCLAVFTGCSSLTTVIKKRNLETQTKLSQTIWLNPENIGTKSVFVQIKNTSTNNIAIENEIKNILIEKGYKITPLPNEANYWLQVNILKLSKMNLRESEAALSGLAGAGIGATLGAYNTGSANTAIGLGIVGGAIGVVSDALIEDIYYTMITDVLVSEKTMNLVQRSQINASTQGTRGVDTTVSNSKSDMNKYQTRVVSTANQVNLKFDGAVPSLKAELVKAISNIF